MQIFEYKCKNCSANLQLDLDNLTGFCPHCGSAVAIESATLSKLLMEREKTRQMKLQQDHEEKMLEKKLEAERREKRVEGIKFFIHSDLGKVMPLFVLLILCFFLLIISSFVGSIKSSLVTYSLPYSDNEVMGKKLETVISAFEDAGFENITIENTTNSFGGVLSEGEVSEVTINGKDVYKSGDKYKKKKTPKIVIVIYSQDGKFSFPYSSETVIGQNIWSVMNKLESMGFNNIQRAGKNSLATIWGGATSDAVIKMTVDGKAKFKLGDRVSLDAPIVIEYYE